MLHRLLDPNFVGLLSWVLVLDGIGMVVFSTVRAMLRIFGAIQGAESLMFPVGLLCVAAACALQLLQARNAGQAAAAD